MAPISSELGNSLDNLKKQIQDAEQFLRSLPGCENERICFESQEDEGYDLFLGLREGRSGELQLSVFAERSEYGSEQLINGDDRIELGGSDDSLPDDVALIDLKIADRVDYAEFIPKLIQLSVQKSSNLPKRVDTVSDAIQAAIAEASQIND